MKSILSRIEQLAKNEGFLPTQFEREIGMGKGTLTRAIKHNTDIQLKWLTTIVENYPLYNLEWLVKGEGEMMKNTPYKIIESNPEENHVNNYENNYRRTTPIDKLIDTVSSQQRVIEMQYKKIEQLEKK